MLLLPARSSRQWHRPRCRLPTNGMREPHLRVPLLAGRLARIGSPAARQRSGSCARTPQLVLEQLLHEGPQHRLRQRLPHRRPSLPCPRRGVLRAPSCLTWPQSSPSRAGSASAAGTGSSKHNRICIYIYSLFPAEHESDFSKFPHKSIVTQGHQASNCVHKYLVLRRLVDTGQRYFWNGMPKSN